MPVIRISFLACTRACHQPSLAALCAWCPVAVALSLLRSRRPWLPRQEIGCSTSVPPSVSCSSLHVHGSRHYVPALMHCCLPTPMCVSSLLSSTWPGATCNCRLTPACIIMTSGSAPPSVRVHRRRGHLFQQQHGQWGRQPNRQHWAGWPAGGVRFGEASLPGPPDPPRLRSASPGKGRPANNPRVYCPVPGCPCSDAASARGWGSHGSTQAHLNDHCAGSLAGDVPAAYLAQHSLCQCQVCGLLVSRQFNGVHPRCRPEARAAPPGPQPQPAQQQPVGPDLCDVFQARIPVQRHVPKAARSVWA